MFSPILIFQLYVVALTSMKDTYGKRQYICDCGIVNEDYLWQTELKAHVLECSVCKVKLSYANLKANKVVQMVSIRTPTKNR